MAATWNGEDMKVQASRDCLLIRHTDVYMHNYFLKFSGDTNKRAIISVDE
jgi:hypothetical protein